MSIWSAGIFCTVLALMTGCGENPSNKQSQPTESAGAVAQPSTSETNDLGQDPLTKSEAEIEVDSEERPTENQNPEQNQSSESSNGNNNDSVNEDESNPNLDGLALYANHCASCHGDAALTEKPNRTAQQITDAINKIGVMRALRSLSSEEITAIANSI